MDSPIQLNIYDINPLITTITDKILVIFICESKEIQIKLHNIVLKQW